VTHWLIFRSSQDNSVVRSAPCRELKPKCTADKENRWDRNDSKKTRAAGGYSIQAADERTALSRTSEILNGRAKCFKRQNAIPHDSY